MYTYTYQHIPTYACTNMYRYTYRHIRVHQHIHAHAPTYTNKHMYHHIHIHIPKSHTSIPPYTHHQVLSIYDTRMLSQNSYSILTCIRGNCITILIPRNEDRNDRNPSTISIRFLHTICRILQIFPVHYSPRISESII